MREKQSWCVYMSLYYGFMGMAGDLGLVCIDGIVHRFCIETKELFSKENKKLCIN